MLLGFALSVVGLYVLAAAYWMLRRFDKTASLLFLLCVNVVVIAFLNRFLLYYILGQFMFMIALYFSIKRFLGYRYHSLAWLLMLGLIPFNLSLHKEQYGVVWSIGATFFVLKSFIILKEALSSGRLPLLNALLSFTFLPSLPAGPIFGAKPMFNENIKEIVTLRDQFRILMMIGWGGAALYVISPYIRGLAVSSSSDFLNIGADMYLSFIALYLDFSGYSTMAIAFGNLFGIQLPVNFNKPYLSTSIVEFWRRWHMSLSISIRTYLFMPLVRKTGAVRNSLVVAFVLAGLWHEFTIQYLLWGIGHGFALGFINKPPNWFSKFQALLPVSLVKVLGWVLTMTWVSLLSYLANL